MTEDYLMNTYKPDDVCFVRGEGIWLYDTNNKAYLDFLSGIAVTSLGHNFRPVNDAIKDQVDSLVHVSNLFKNKLANELAKKIGELINGITSDNEENNFADLDIDFGKVFFCNSGAEANECAIKLVRKIKGPKAHKIISMENSFHGRTLATLAATGQKSKQEPFEPLPADFVQVPYDNLTAVKNEIDSATAAVLVEPIQGEAGIIVPSADYLKGISEICKSNNVLLIVDEIQTGLGRCGAWFKFQDARIIPDVVTIAKSLGNGVPIGACWAKTEIADNFKPGDHGTTYGGQLLACRAALATLETLVSINAPVQAKRLGDIIKSKLKVFPQITEVRGTGLLLGIKFDKLNAKEVQLNSLKHGLVVNAPRSDTVRIAPSYLINESDVDIFIEKFADAIADTKSSVE